MPRSRFLTIVGILGIVTALCADRIIPDLIEYGVLTDPVWFEHSGGQFPLIRKATLAPLRLLHFLMLAYVVSTVFSPTAQFWKTRCARPLVVCGQHSLAIFCLGIFLMYVAVVIVIRLRLGTGWVTVLNLVGCLLMILAAWTVDRYNPANKSR